MVDFSNREHVRRWLADKPRDVATVVAARAALRVVPLLVTGIATPGFKKTLILPVFRATAVSWVAGRDPTLIAQLLRATRAAADAAYAAADAAYAAADAADPAD